MRISKSLLLSGLAVLLGGCAVSHVPKARNYEALALKYQAEPDSLFSDTRTFREQDLIVVRLGNDRVPAIVKKVLPNGNLFIEGHQKHLSISGVVRPMDIAIDHSVRSAYVADAEFIDT